MAVSKGPKCDFPGSGSNAVGTGPCFAVATERNGRRAKTITTPATGGHSVENHWDRWARRNLKRLEIRRPPLITPTTTCPTRFPSMTVCVRGLRVADLPQNEVNLTIRVSMDVSRARRQMPIFSSDSYSHIVFSYCFTTDGIQTR